MWGVHVWVRGDGGDAYEVLVEASDGNPFLDDIGEQRDSKGCR